MTLQDWADLSTAVAAFSTLVLVCFGAFQLWALRQQLQQTDRSVDAAVTAAEAAQRAVMEAARARIDDQAPRVVAVLSNPEWQPVVGTFSMEESQLFDSTSVHGSVEANKKDFYFPENREALLWFTVKGILINEGAGTARVRFDGGNARFIASMSELVSW